MTNSTTTQKTEEKGVMSQNILDKRQIIKAINDVLKAGEPNNYSSDHKGYAGYKPQNILDAINSQLIGEWSLEVLEHATYPTNRTDKNGNKINHAFTKVRLKLFGQTIDSFASHPITDDPGDAFKSAETDAMKKALAHFSIGNRAYHGLLK